MNLRQVIRRKMIKETGKCKLNLFHVSSMYMNQTYNVQTIVRLLGYGGTLWRKSSSPSSSRLRSTV